MQTRATNAEDDSGNDGLDSDERAQIDELVHMHEEEFESYVDPNWPTTDSELLSVPDENR